MDCYGSVGSLIGIGTSTCPFFKSVCLQTRLRSQSAALWGVGDLLGGFTERCGGGVGETLGPACVLSEATRSRRDGRSRGKRRNRPERLIA